VHGGGGGGDDDDDEDDYEDDDIRGSGNSVFVVTVNTS
jgi:hypothetical protein